MEASIVAVSVGTGPRIRLQSGAWLDLLEPHSSDFTIEDIAHGLAHTCRYAGQSDGFYSVAEHSLLVCQTVATHPLEALMHDASEAFIGDVTRPLKQLLPDYKRIEALIDDAIRDRFALATAGYEDIKKADLRVLAAEQAQIMPEGTSDWAIEAGIEPAEVTVEKLPPEQAKQRFLDTFRALCAERRSAGSGLR